jgi:ribosomal protein S12 methylthiotransferase
MARAQAISAAKLAARVGSRVEVIVDEVDDAAATCRTRGDAPEIDGNLFIDEGFEGLSPGDILTVTVEEADEYDLWGSRAGRPGYHRRHEGDLADDIAPRARSRSHR